MFTTNLLELNSVQTYRETETKFSAMKDGIKHTRLSLTLKTVLEQKYKHDVNSFCQGVEIITNFRFHNARIPILESSGRYGKSQFKIWDLKTGKVLRSCKLPDCYFAEGVTLLKKKIYLLTWKEKRLFIYDADSFRLLKQFRYPFEGWGLTNDGDFLWAGDGTEKLRRIDPENLKVKDVLHVYFRKENSKIPVFCLNDLTFVKGEIWANIYQTNCVARIDPHSGEAFDIIDFSCYIPREYQSRPDFVMNGITYDARRNFLLTTGKCWPVVYVFKLE